MSKRKLTIDGNFMMKRLLFQYDFMSNPIEDRNNYLMDLCYHMAKEVERVQPFVDNIVFCRDHRSWRKDIPVVKPLQFTPSGELISPDGVMDADYKANRKVSEDRNWELIYSAFNEFVEVLNRDFGVAVTHVPGAEGDDAIWAWTKFNHSQRIKSAIYCTDSDLNQLVSSSCVSLRRIKSKASPEGEIVVHPIFKWLFENSVNPTPENIMTFNPIQWQDDIEMLKNKSIGNGLATCYPFWFIFQHLIIGSTKDNVPEIFTWKSKSGNQNQHIQQKHIISALLLSKIDDPHSITQDHLYDEPFLKAFLINLCHVTKQTHLIEHVDHLYKMIVCNRKLNFLSEREIPQTVQQALIENIDAQKDMQADMKSLSNANLIMEALKVSNNKIYQNLGI